MATVKVKGFGTIELGYTQAKEVQDRWEAYLKAGNRQDRVIKVGTLSTRMSQIDGVNLKGESQAKDQSDLIKKNDNEYAVDRAAELKLPPSERAQQLGMFKLFYWARTGEQPDERTQKIAITFQTKYFGKFPNRTLVNPIIFKKIIAKPKKDLNAFESSALHLIERAVREDMIHAIK